MSLTDTPFITHLAHLVGEGWTGFIGEQCNQGDHLTDPFELMDAVLTICSESLRLIVTYHIPLQNKWT